MTHRLQRWSTTLGLCGSFLLIAPACSAGQTPPVVETQDDTDISAQVQPLVEADVVYLGEHHDSAADHRAQMAIIEAMYAENPDIAIALEMFQRPFQPVIDRYLAGDISEAELVQQTEYERRWGFPWEYYAPMLRFAQAHQLPVLALNAPSEVVRQVAREGLVSLDDDDFRYIPPLDDIDTSNSDYQDFVRTAFGAHGGHGDFNFDNFFAAQVVWDETMAATIAEFKQISPDTTVVVIAGSGHVIYDYGIPDRVARRLGADLQQTSVLINFPEDLLADSSEGVADLIWYAE